MSGYLTPEEFISHFLAGNTEAIEGREVRGNVALYGRVVPIAVRALDVTFWGDVDMSECRFERSLDLSGCHFAKSVSFRNTHVGGTLDLSEVLVRTQASATGTLLDDSYSIDLTGIRVENDLLLTGLTVQYGTAPAKARRNGDLVATGMRIRGQTDLTGIKTDGSVDLAGSHFEGNVVVAALDMPDTRDHSCIVGGHLMATNCVFQGNLALSGVTIQRDLQLWSSRFQGNLVLSGVTIQGDLQLWSSRIDGVFFCQPAISFDEQKRKKVRHFSFIGGDLHLGTAQIAYLDFESCAVKGRFMAFAARFGQVNLHFGATVRPCVFGQFIFEGCHVEGDLRLMALSVTGRDKTGRWRGASVKGTAVGGALLLWAPSALMDLDEDQRIDSGRGPESLKPLIHGDLKIIGCTVTDELDLTNVHVTGRILLDDSSVGRDLRLRSVATAAHELERFDTQLTRPEHQNLLATRAKALSMTNLVCQNDVDLTGLVLQDDPDDPDDPNKPDLLTDPRPKPGFLDARGCEVRKALRLFEPLPERLCKPLAAGNADAGNFTRVPGAIDLSSSRLGALILSFHSFKPEEKSDKPKERKEKSKPDGDESNDRACEIGLVLAAARIDEFRLQVKCKIKRRDGLFTVPRLKFPKPIDMRDIEVAQWDIHDSSCDRQGLSRRDAFASLVDAEDGYRRSTFLSVERALRNRGHDADADYIYRLMKRRGAQIDIKDRERRASRNLRRTILLPFANGGTRVFDGLFRFFLGYGTRPGRLAWAIVILWLVALPIFEEKANLQPSLALLGTESGRFEPDRVAREGEAPQDWSTTAAVGMSLQFHLPVVALAPRDDWNLRQEGATCYNPRNIPLLGWLLDRIAKPRAAPSAAESCAGWRLPLPPQIFGVLISILNWIAWPLLLAFAIRRLLVVDRA
ncbi:MAG: pentapeptide repeat-containing protein [Pseudochelatococcus sp.]|jgi:hypothetical protein|uniref:pentapeptide repeat-containing protein n=1 Tax=Pseudochelatococcus sp. TaxID=2020869 RepID=UPI003D8FD3E9